MTPQTNNSAIISVLIVRLLKGIIWGCQYMMNCNAHGLVGSDSYLVYSRQCSVFMWEILSEGVRLLSPDLTRRPETILALWGLDQFGR